MIFQSNYKDNTQKLLQAFDRELGTKNQQLKTLRAQLEDADKALEELGLVINDKLSSRLQAAKEMLLQAVEKS